MKKLLVLWWIVSILFVILTYWNWLGSLHADVISVVWKPVFAGVATLSASIFLKRLSLNANVNKYIAGIDTIPFYVRKNALRSIHIRHWMALVFIAILTVFHAVFSDPKLPWVTLYLIHGALQLAFVLYHYRKRTPFVVIGDEHILTSFVNINIEQWDSVREVNLRYGELHIVPANREAQVIPLSHFDDVDKYAMLDSIARIGPLHKVFIAQPIWDLIDQNAHE